MLSETSLSPLSMVLSMVLNMDDAEDIRLQKSLLVVGSFMFTLAGAVWGIAYILFNERAAGAIPISYALLSILNLIYFSLTQRYHFFRSSQLALILVLPFLLQLALGGFINSSAVIFWSFICPLGALMFAEIRQAPRWLAAYLVLLVISGILQPHVRISNQLPQGFIIVFFVLNIGAVSTIAFVLLHYFVGQKDYAYSLLRVEQDRSEALLLNVLPREIAGRLMKGERVIADHHPSVSILFADLVGFTPLTDTLTPNEMVELLNQIFTHFDSLIEKMEVEKIRTIGDNYMIAAGLPKPRADHAQVLARLALEMNAYVESLAPIEGRRLAFRFGLNSGPVVAGVLGHKKFTYDVWGDTVNTASRMESQGEAGKIQITRAAYELLKNDFLCEPNGPISVKGKGPMETWFLMGPGDRM